jgi:hypothetical protein
VVRRSLWRVLQFLAGALLVGLAVRAIAINWQTLRTQPVEWHLSSGWIAASVAVVFAAYAVLIEAWRRVVLSMGNQLGFFPALRIWFLASLGKYVPGKVWSIAGAAVLAQRAGVDPSSAVAGALVLQALALGSGAVAVALTARDAFRTVAPGVLPIALAVLLAAVAGIASLASQPFLDRISRFLPRSLPPLRAVPAHMLALAFAANLLAWTGYGVALLFLARGVLPDSSRSLRLEDWGPGSRSSFCCWRATSASNRLPAWRWQADCYSPEPRSFQPSRSFLSDVPQALPPPARSE